MPSLGQNLAYTYELPDDNYPQQQQQQAVPMQAPEVGVPNAPSGLQQIEGVTREYYQKNANLKSFVKGMWENYKIDVTKPNVNDPLAMKYHELYQQAVADVMLTGDKLKQGGDMQKQMLMSKMRGDVRFAEGTNFNQTNAMDLAQTHAYSTGVDPLVQQSNAVNARGRDTMRGVNASNKQVDANIAELQSRLDQATDPGEKARLQEQIAMVQRSTHDPRVFAPQRPDTPSSTELEKKNMYGNFLKRWATILTDPTAYKERYEDGQLLLENTEYAGDKYGYYEVRKNGSVTQEERIIKKIVMNPETGEVTIKFDGKVPDEVVNKKDLINVAKNYITTNSNTGMSVGGVGAFAVAEGYSLDDGSVPPSKVIGDNSAAIESNKVTYKERAKGAEKLSKLMEDEIGMFKSAKIKFASSKGDVFIDQEKGLDVGVAKFGGAYTLKVGTEGAMTFETKDKAIDWMISEGIYDDFLKNKHSIVKGDQEITEEDELINKYF